MAAMSHVLSTDAFSIGRPPPLYTAAKHKKTQHVQTKNLPPRNPPRPGGGGRIIRPLPGGGGGPILPGGPGGA